MPTQTKQMQYKMGEIRDITEQLAHACGLKYSDITGSSRRADITAARRLIWEKLTKEGFSYSKIGSEFGRCHNVIIYGLRKLREQTNAGDETVAKYKSLMDKTELSGKNDNYELLKIYADRLGISANELTGESRRSQITLKRYIAYRMLYKNNLTYSQIAELFNRRAPSVFYGLLKLNELASIRDARLMREIEKMKQS